MLLGNIYLFIVELFSFLAALRSGSVSAMQKKTQKYKEKKTSLNIPVTSVLTMLRGRYEGVRCYEV